MWRASFILMILAEAGVAECMRLAGEAVTAGELAQVAPEFAALPAETRVAWAPAPGVTRWIAAGELARIGRQHGLTVTGAGVCLMRAVAKLGREQLLEAMRTAGRDTAGRDFGGRDLAIELLAFGPAEAPPGKLEFNAKSLPPLPRQEGAPVVQWRGRLVTESGRSYPVWARARLTVKRAALVTLRPVGAGELLEASAVERVEVMEYPGWEAPVGELELAVGRRLRRAVAPRTRVLPQWLAVKRDVERGDAVAVTLPGEATLTAQAESPGRAGETILLKNPLTGRRFPSKVTGAGRATMIALPSTNRSQEHPDADRP